MLKPTEHTEHDVTALTGDIIKTLLYFDLFQYPLTEEEVLFFCPSVYSKEETHTVMSRLLREGYIYKFGNFFSLHNDPSLISRRIAGNQLASQKLKSAKVVSKFISWFPYVRAVMISGSLSKGYMDKESDIDFFIITAPGRLWIARTLLVLFKRIFLLNSHKNFCVNYFIDTDNLEIEEKNLFTAIECITLIPTYGDEIYHEFLAANAWVLEFFPNSIPRNTDAVHIGNSFAKVISEWIMNNRVGNGIDQYFMGITLKRWKQLFRKHYSEKDFEIAFKTKKYASKNHPRFYQKKILDAYQQKIVAFEKNHKMNLTPATP